jgi:UDP-N-acetylmuramoyl-tripeptide--D-alanyl-D-alanine ligase
VADAGVDVLIAIGGAAVDALVNGARAAGMAADRIHHFATSAAAADVIAALVQPDDLVLVKGSRGVRTDLIVDRLREVA